MIHTLLGIHLTEKELGLKEDNSRTYVVSKKVGLISTAWKMVRFRFPKSEFAVYRYSKEDLFDAHSAMLFHAENYYFCIVEKN